jgi:hypothetical protein
MVHSEPKERCHRKENPERGNFFFYALSRLCGKFNRIQATQKVL